jgi:hypothetical protein
VSGREALLWGVLYTAAAVFVVAYVVRLLALAYGWTPIAVLTATAIVLTAGYLVMCHRVKDKP